MTPDEAWADGVWRAAMRPDLAMTVTEWADKYRELGTESSPEPGPWRTSRVPYLKEIMDCLSPSSSIEKVVAMKGAQIAFTEAGLNWAGYVMHHTPAPMLIVWPTTAVVKKNSKIKVDGLISCPVIKPLVASPRSRDSGNTVAMKEFRGGFLAMVGANSAPDLRSLSIRFLMLDEVDAYPPSVDEEGDVVALAIRRTGAFIRRKIFLLSTPKLKGSSRIETEYLLSDQRVYEVPCKNCGEFSRIVFANIGWPKADGSVPFDKETGLAAWPEPEIPTRNRPDLAFWWCPECGRIHQEHEKESLLAGGRWRATAEGDGKTAGFHLSALYSPWTKWGEIATDFTRATAAKDSQALQVVVNTMFGETWEDEVGETIEPATISKRAEPCDWKLALPPGVAFLTASVDTQDDRLELEVVGWGKDEESWSIEYRQIWGDPSDKAVWQELDSLLQRRFPHSRALPDMPISAVCIDTQGHNSEMAYAFIRDKHSRRVWGIKGSTAQGKPPIWPRSPSHKNKGKVPLYFVGVTSAKEVIFSRLKKIAEPGPGFMHFPNDRADAYFAQLVAEIPRISHHKGRETVWWDKGGRRNEAFDLKVYNLAALKGLEAGGVVLNKEAERVALVPVKGRGVVVAEPSPRVRANQPRRMSVMQGL